MRRHKHRVAGLEAGSQRRTPARSDAGRYADRAQTTGGREASGKAIVRCGVFPNSHH